MKKTFKKILHKIPYVERLHMDTEQYKANSCFPPGHFYSPIVNTKEIIEKEDVIWASRKTPNIDDIDLNIETQKKLLSSISSFYRELPFKKKKKEFDTNRYIFENGMYSYTDGIVLYGMLRHLSPKRVIEVGSGYSSALMLDVNEQFFDNGIKLTFIEPFPDRLRKIIMGTDGERATIIEEKVQDVPIDVFAQLESGDILFIDSTHVSKCGSDVNHILFKILPNLKKGTYIHFHDIFYPFEYPKEWVIKGYNWNENYLLRAFLMNNKGYSIQLFSDYMHLHHKDDFSKMTLSYKNTGGNLWIKKE